MYVFIMMSVICINVSSLIGVVRILFEVAEGGGGGGGAPRGNSK